MKTKQLAYCALLTALGTMALWLGAFFQTMDLTVAMFAALPVLWTKTELGTKYASAVYFGTAILALILTAEKSIAVFYLCFFGCYPMVKAWCERHRRVLSTVGKLLFSLLSFATVFFVTDLILGLWATDLPIWYRPTLALLAEVTFWLYDFALSKMLLFYQYRLRKYFRFR